MVIASRVKKCASKLLWVKSDLKLTKLELFPWISRKFRKSRKSWKWDLLKRDITEILEILEMGLSEEWVVLKIVSKCWVKRRVGVIFFPGAVL